MDGVTIRGSGEQARLPLAALPLLLCGVWGFLLLFRSLDGVSFDPRLPCLAAAVLLALLWAGERYAGRWFRPAALAGLAVLGVLLWQSWADGPGAQAGALLGYWFGDRIPALESWFGMKAPESAAELAAVLAVFLSLALFTVEYLLRDHELPYTIATALLVYVPLLGLRADTLAVFLLALFRLALRTAQNTASRDGLSLLPAKQRTRIAGQYAVLLSALLSLSFLAAVPLARDHGDALYAPAYGLEALVVRGMRALGERLRGQGPSNSRGVGQDGKIGGGNQYQYNTAQLELTTSALPTTPLYLRSFIGGDYTGGAWAAADDEVIFQAVQPELMPEDPSAWSGSAAQWFNSMYFEMNQEQSTRVFNALLSSQSNPDLERLMPITHCFNPRTLRLRNLTRGDSGRYTPYYSSPIPARLLNPDAAYLTTESPYGFLYYQQDEMGVDWEFLSETNYGKSSWYRTFQDAYLREAEEAYTRVPVELVPRLAELVRENPLSDLDKITAFILYSLHSRATYTLTPGRTAGNQDVVEDFLFEKGQGYCQHFAAAAVLMYRLYGVPARYAAGYVALPSEFAPVYGGEDGGTLLGDVTGSGAGGNDATGSITDETGTASGEPLEWQASVTDHAAHAWVEIFLDGYGWTPVEVTPASPASAAGTQAAASYPGFDRDVQEEIAREHGWNLGNNSVADGYGEDGGNSPTYPINPGESGDFGWNASPGGTGDSGGAADRPGGQDDSDAPSQQPATLRTDGGMVNYIVFFLFTFLLLLPPVFVRRRDRILARMDAMDSREALYRMGILLRFAGTPVDEVAEDYADQLSAAVPAIRPEEAERLAAAAARAAFGASPPEAAESTERAESAEMAERVERVENAEDAFARDLYRRAAEWVYGTLNRWRRIAFRWWYVLG